MTIYLNDDRDYSVIIEKWVRNFYDTMDEDILDGFGEAGDESGQAPAGVKIIFDGYGYDEETDEENADHNMVSFAVFVHKNSLTEEFVPHELTPWALIHRPKEEVCIYAWYDVENDEWSINALEETSDHDMTDEEVMVVLEYLYEYYFKPWEGKFRNDPETGLPTWPFDKP